MSNHNYTRAGGVWNTGTGLLAAELADLDWKSTHSLSDSGGVYSFADSMVIGGDSFLVEWQFEVPVVFAENITGYNGFTLYGDGIVGISTADELTVVATAEFTGPVEFSNDVEFIDPVTFQNDVLFSDSVTIGSSGTDEFHVVAESFIEGPATFSSDATFEQSVTFENAVFLEGQFNAPVTCLLGDSSHSVQLNGSTQVFKPIRMQSGGALVQRAAIGANANTTYSPLEYHEVVILDGGITGNVDYTIDDTGCSGNEEIIFTNKDQASSMFVKRPGGATIAGITGGWIRCKRMAGTWYGVQRGDITVN